MLRSIRQAFELCVSPSCEAHSRCGERRADAAERSLRPDHSVQTAARRHEQQLRKSGRLEEASHVRSGAASADARRKSRAGSSAFGATEDLGGIYALRGEPSA